MCESKKIESADEFLAGQIACKNGEKCSQGASKDFERGYMAQYEMEQILTERSRRNGG